MKSSNADNDARINDLQARLAEQDHAVAQLSDEVYQQQLKVAELEVKVRHIMDRLKSLSDVGETSESGPEIPPHY